MKNISVAKRFWAAVLIPLLMTMVLATIDPSPAAA
jgi:hypothetical protein